MNRTRAKPTRTTIGTSNNKTRNVSLDLVNLQVQRSPVRSEPLLDYDSLSSRGSYKESQMIACDDVPISNLDAFDEFTPQLLQQHKDPASPSTVDAPAPLNLLQQIRSIVDAQANETMRQIALLLEPRGSVASSREPILGVHSSPPTQYRTKTDADCLNLFQMH